MVYSFLLFLEMNGEFDILVSERITDTNFLAKKLHLEDCAPALVDHFVCHAEYAFGHYMVTIGALNQITSEII